MNLIEKGLQYIQENTGMIVVKLAIATAILLVGLVVAKVAAALVSRALTRQGGHRAETLAPTGRSLVMIAGLGGALVLALDQVGFSVATLLAGAGVLGLAIGFGAQTLVKDCLSGFFLILDDVLATGDVVEVDGVSGTVERVGLRITCIRAFSGQLWYVPNGKIERLGNWNRGWARAIVDVGLAYEQDASKGIATLLRVGKDWAEKHDDIVLEPPVAQGLTSLNSSDVGVRLVVKLDNKKNDLWGAERELRLLAKAALDRDGIEIPFPRQVTYHRCETGESGPIAVHIATASGAGSQASPN